MLTQELSQGVSYWKDGYKERLRQMFSTFTKEEEDGVKSLTESYHKYNMSNTSASILRKKT